MSIATQYPQEYIERLKRDFLREVHPYNQMLDRIQMYKPVSILVTHEGVIITNSNETVMETEIKKVIKDIKDIEARYNDLFSYPLKKSQS